MSAMQIDMKFSAVVEKDEHMPPWVQELCRMTGKTNDEIVKTMIESEMYEAGEKFIAKFPELFRGGLA